MEGVVMLNSIKNRVETLCILVVCIIIVFLMRYNKVYASVDKNVLFISSYSESFLTVPQQIKGLQEIFEVNHVNLDIEYMDTKRYSSDENISNFYKSLKYKLNNTISYDAIIVGDDAALQFAMDYQKELFSGLPIIFF
jgi:hypothetical protein